MVSLVDSNQSSNGLNSSRVDPELKKLVNKVLRALTLIKSESKQTLLGDSSNLEWNAKVLHVPLMRQMRWRVGDEISPTHQSEAVWGGGEGKDNPYEKREHNVNSFFFQYKFNKKYEGHSEIVEVRADENL